MLRALGTPRADLLIRAWRATGRVERASAARSPPTARASALRPAALRASQRVPRRASQSPRSSTRRRATRATLPTRHRSLLTHHWPPPLPLRIPLFRRINRRSISSFSTAAYPMKTSTQTHSTQSSDIFHDVDWADNGQASIQSRGSNPGPSHLDLSLPSISAPNAAGDTLFWDVNGATAGTGGTGNWLGSSIWRLNSATGALQAWSNDSVAISVGLPAR